MAYLDAGFLMTALFKTPSFAITNATLRDLSAPFRINRLHHLQVENVILLSLRSDEPEQRDDGLKGQSLWRNYLAEGVFQIDTTEWETALALAAQLHKGLTQPTPWPLLLHPALAAVEAATHFASYDPRSRVIGKALGMNLLPEDI